MIIQIKNGEIIFNNKLKTLQSGKIYYYKNITIQKVNNIIKIKRKFYVDENIYFTKIENKVVLFSNLEYLKKQTDLKLKLDNINEFLTYGYLVPPETMLEGIYQLPNFGEISIDLTEEKLKVKLDYNFYHKKNIRCKIEDYELAKLKKVNKKTLFYSGGLDSTILAIVYGSNIDNYYATGFNFEECDLIEKNYAITGAEALGIDLKFKEYDFKKLLLLLPEAIFYSQSTLNHIQTLLLYKLMKDLKFSDDYILNGQGADAIFGTYAQYKFYNSLQPNIMTEKFIKNICCDYSNTKSKEFYVCKYNEHDSQLNKNFYLDITGDCDLTIISWSMLAKKCKKTIIFPFYTQKNYNFVKNFEWNDRVCEPKHILREYGKKLNVPDEIIYRSKASFGPVSTGWFEEILLLFPLCSKFKNIDEQLIKKVENRYCLWNLINISIWSMLFLDNIPINDVKLNIKELLSYDK